MRARPSHFQDELAREVRLPIGLEILNDLAGLVRLVRQAVCCSIRRDGQDVRTLPVNHPPSRIRKRKTWRQDFAQTLYFFFSPTLPPSLYLSRTQSHRKKVRGPVSLPIFCSCLCSFPPGYIISEGRILNRQKYQSGTCNALRLLKLMHFNKE